MLQDIAPHRFNNAFRADCQPREDDYVIIVEGNKVVQHNHRELPRVKDVDGGELIYLFAIDETRYYLADSVTVPKGYTFDTIRGMGDQTQMFAAATALQLARWYANNRYCGHCGHEMIRDHVERKMVCPHCGHFVYPHIAPAVIVGVRNGDQLLLSQSALGHYRHYAMIAGYTEVGETIEETVRREVFEEVGLKVKNITYYRSQPWSFSDSLLLGFYCDVDGDPTITVDHHELSLAIWTPRNDIPLHPDNISLTGEMMKRFKEGKDQQL